jgi:hypothetical protein
MCNRVKENYEHTFFEFSSSYEIQAAIQTVILNNESADGVREWRRCMMNKMWNRLKENYEYTFFEFSSPYEMQAAIQTVNLTMSPLMLYVNGDGV